MLDPFSQTRIGNDSNPFNSTRPDPHQCHSVAAHDDVDDDQEFQERLVYKYEMILSLQNTSSKFI